MTKTEEPLHVTFARVVLCDDLRLWNGKWVKDCPGSVFGWVDARDYASDRALCQEGEELNELSVSISARGDGSWHARPNGAGPEVWGERRSLFIRWAIAAKRAGVPVRLPGGAR